MLQGKFIYIVLAIVVVLFVAYILFAYIRDKRKKKKIKLANEQLEMVAKTVADEIRQKILAVIYYNNEFLQNFQVSIGSYKMSELTTTSKDILNDIIDSGDFKTYIIGSVKYSAIVDNILTLRDSRSNGWNQKNTDQISFFETGIERLGIDKISEEDIQKIKENILSIYEEKLHIKAN